MYEVRTTEMVHTVYIGIGSNLGEKKQNCLEAVRRIGCTPDIEVVKISDWYETEAVTLSGENQPTYVNGAARLSTKLSPFSLFKALKEIEIAMGRPAVRQKWANRVIDLDIIFYNDLILSGEELVIPHPEAEKRIFVLKPLCDIEPAFVHPALKKTVYELYETVLRTSYIVKFCRF